MKTETMVLIFGVFMIGLGYEIIHSGHLFFRGVSAPYLDETKFVGPLFVAVGVISILFAAVLHIKNRKK